MKHNYVSQSQKGDSWDYRLRVNWERVGRSEFKVSVFNQDFLEGVEVKGFGERVRGVLNRAKVAITEMSLDYSESKADVRKNSFKLTVVEGKDYEQKEGDLLVLEPSELKVFRVEV